jgi:hypothetical protein
LSGQCQGSGDRTERVMIHTYTLYYHCACCAARFGPAQVGRPESPVAPAHEAVPARLN